MLHLWLRLRLVMFDVQTESIPFLFHILRRHQNCWHFAANIFQYTFFNEWENQILSKCILRYLIDDKSSLIRVKWRDLMIQQNLANRDLPKILYVFANIIWLIPKYITDLYTTLLKLACIAIIPQLTSFSIQVINICRLDICPNANMFTTVHVSILAHSAFIIIDVAQYFTTIQIWS